MGTSNGAETIKKNEYINYYIWIDPNINNKENTEYAKTLLKFYKNLLLFTKIEEAIKVLDFYKENCNPKNKFLVKLSDECKF